MQRSSKTKLQISTKLKDEAGTFSRLRGRLRMIKNEGGAVIVEAAIYIPVVIFIAAALIYLALFNMQEYLIMYEAQKACTVVSREVTFPGYSVLGVGETDAIDFPSIPGDAQVTASYQDRIKNLGSIYNEVVNVFNVIAGTPADISAYESKFNDELTAKAIITIGTIGSPDIKVDKNLLGTGITVKFTHHIPTPAIFTYLGYNNTDISTAAYSYTVNPAGFVRGVDLAVDFVDYIAKKLGFEKDFKAFKEKTGKVLDVIF